MVFEEGILRSPQKAGLPQNDSTRKTVAGMAQYRGRNAATSPPPCHSEQAVFNKNTNIKAIEKNDVETITPE